MAENNLERLARAYAVELQALDTAATELLTLTTLDGAEGVQLDGLGQIISTERQGLDDEAYRSLLRSQIRVNTSGGAIEQLNEIIRLATNTTIVDGAFTLVESFPADFKVDFVPILDPDVGPIAAEAMYRGKAAGVHGVFEYHDTEPVFAFDGVGGSEFDGGYYLKAAIRNRGARESEIL